MLEGMDFQPLWITFKVAFMTTLILLLLGTPLALWLSRIQGKKKAVLEAVVALPLVLPPTVLGFYFLVVLSPTGPIGSLWAKMGFEPLTFSLSGVIIGSIVYSLPFMVQPLMQGFEQMGSRPSEVAATLGASPWDRFFSVTLPLTRRYYLLGATLAFAHTVGEFGVVLMIGGNIPGVTQVASIAIYDHVEQLEYSQAHILSFIMLAVSLTVLSIVYGMNRRMEVKAG